MLTGSVTHQGTITYMDTGTLNDDIRIGPTLAEIKQMNLADDGNAGHHRPHPPVGQRLPNPAL